MKTLTKDKKVMKSKTKMSIQEYIETQAKKYDKAMKELADA